MLQLLALQVSTRPSLLLAVAAMTNEMRVEQVVVVVVVVLVVLLLVVVVVVLVVVAVAVAVAVAGVAVVVTMRAATVRRTRRKLSLPWRPLGVQWNGCLSTWRMPSLQVASSSSSVPHCRRLRSFGSCCIQVVSKNACWPMASSSRRLPFNVALEYS